MRDTDREARLEEIRDRWLNEADRVKAKASDNPVEGLVNSSYMAAHARSDVRFLLSEIDRLKAKLEGEDG